MDNCITGSVMFYKLNNVILAGMCASYVEYLIHIGKSYYAKLCETKGSKFTCKKRVWKNIQISRVEIVSHTTYFEIHQRKYLAKLEKIAKSPTFADFRSLRAKLLWIKNSRLNTCCGVALLTEITEDRFEEKERVLQKPQVILLPT